VAVAPLGWTGFYFGVNAGGSIGTDSTTQTATFSSTALGANGLLNNSGRYNPTGWVFGGQVGYNWQVSSFVFGLEADWQGSLQKDRRNNCTPAATIAFFGAGANGFGYCLSSEQKITNVGTARARAGVDRHGALWYVTGGLAWGTVKENDAFAGSANTTVFPAALQPGPFLPGAAAFSATRTGWTVGAGVETMIAGGWSAKLEYLYVDLGSISDTLPIAINPAFGPAFTTGGVASATNTSRVRDNIVRLGLNYRFGGDGVYAKF
jgi:outer membrane immunogenic protein